MKNAVQKKSSARAGRQKRERTFDDEIDTNFQFVIKICKQKVLIPRPSTFEMGFVYSPHVFVSSLRLIETTTNCHGKNGKRERSLMGKVLESS
jgi:hypothetical protein